MKDGLSVAVLLLNEEENIPRLINYFYTEKKQDFPVQILFIDNGSTDGTLKILENAAAREEGSGMEIVRLEGNNLAMARQYALQNAKYSLIAFTDADCLPPRGWFGFFFRSLEDTWQGRSLIGAGGGNLVPLSDNRFYDALAIALSTWICALNSLQAKPLEKKCITDHIPTCNVFLWREKALSIGGYNKFYNDVCEDLEFSRRAEAHGLKFCFYPGWEVKHYHRKSLLNWAEKMFRYGRGQLKVARDYPRHIMGVKGVPLLAVIFSLAMLVYSYKLFAALLIVYLIVVFAVAARGSARSKCAGLIPEVALIILVTHVAYALGEIWGLRYLGRK